MKTLQILLVICLSVLALTACTYDYTKNMAGRAFDATGLGTRVEVKRHYQWRLSPETPLWVAVPQTDLSPRQNYELTQTIFTELRKKFPLSQSASLAADVDSALARARAKNKPITIYPYVYRHENNLSSIVEISRNYDDSLILGRDHIGISLRAYNSYSGKLIDVVELQASSKPIDFSAGKIDPLVSLLAAGYGEELVATAPK